MANQLYHGDSREVLKQLDKNSVDLIYLDPPFYSNRIHVANENSSKRIEFSDIWDNGFDEYIDFMGEIFSDSYKLLKDTGSLFLHCDWHAVHYLKVELDKIFGVKNFRNEIIWKRHNSQNNSKQGAKIFGRVHDTILVYSKTDKYTWNQPYEKYSEEYVKKAYRRIDENGERYALSDLSGPGGATKGNPYFEFMGFTRHWRYNKEKMIKLFDEGKIIQTKPGTVPKLKRYLKDMKGIPINDIWMDISNVQTKDKKDILYPTQKPVELLDRIIETATNKQEIILDAFCGSGTTLISAAKLHRKCILVDENDEAVNLTKKRLKELKIPFESKKFLKQSSIKCPI